ncbi:helix-turn-helix domain-containing protein [Clostridium sp.]|uniref:helix-turn-helix domain-containing protein n=1 Tax=Clostridium sp. TaxID=1506 RepID=UPI00359F70B2
MFNIGDRIRELRKLNKLTTKELGYKMNVHQSFISSLENNTKKCSMDNLFKLCEIFNITLSEFFNDDSEHIVLTSGLKDLINGAKNLTPEQLEKLNEFLKTFF